MEMHSNTSSHNKTDIIWWDAVCGPRSYDNAFWDLSNLLYTNNPNFTKCFQETILVWIPCAVLWLCAPFYIFYLTRRKTLSTCFQKSLINTVKIIIGVLIVITQLVQLGHVISGHVNGEEVPLAKFLSPSLFAATVVLSVVLFHIEFHKGCNTSGIQFTFWTLSVIVGIVPFRSFIMNAKDVEVLNCVTFYVTYGLCVIQFVLQLMADNKALVTSAVRSEERVPLLAATNNESEDVSQPNHLNCPEITSSTLSKFTFFWMTSLIVKGFKRTLLFEDLFDLREENTVKAVIPRFERLMKPIFNKYRRDKAHEKVNTSGQKHDEDVKIEHATKEPSIFWALYGSASWNIFYGWLVMIPATTFEFLNPFLLNEMIYWIQSKDTYMWKGYLLSLLLLLNNLFLYTMHQWNFILCQVAGLRLRSVVSAGIYRKMLRMSGAARKKYTSGEIINMMSVDSEVLQTSTMYSSEMIFSPIIITVAVVFLWQIVGPASLMCIGIFVVIGVLGGGFVGQFLTKFQTEQMGHKDERVKMVNEILNGIKVLKFYAWESSFLKSVGKVRSKEMNAIRKKAYVDSILGVVWFCAPVMAALGVFVVYIMTSPDKTIDAQTAFVSLSLINIMNWPIMSLPMALQAAVEAYVSLKRIRSYFLGEELDMKAVEDKPGIGNAISIQDGTFTWDVTEKPTLHNVNMNIREGQIIAVVGKVGCGKSSMVSAILGEMEKLAGHVKVKGSVAYVPQQPWIQNKTVKDNILFSQPVNESRYQGVIDACALKTDLKMLPAGDETEIGEKGINLSGGQKQRVSLARAVYQNKDIYLLDDPLSAVDAHVGKHIFENVIGPNGILRHRTRIFATHAVTYLPHVDKIIVLKNGRVSETGTFKELLGQDGDFAEFLQEYFKEDDDSDPELEGVRQIIERQRSRVSDQDTDDMKDESEQKRTRTKSRQISSTSKEEAVEGLPSPDSGNLIDEETTEIGSVKWSVIGTYMSSGGLGLCVGAIFWMMMFVASQVFTNVWLSNWSSDAHPVTSEQLAFVNVRIGVYGALGISQGITVFAMSMILYIGSVHASKKMHNNLLNRIMRAPMAFFDTTPLGRIMNRFSSDMESLDVTLPGWIVNYLLSVSPVICTFIIICYSTPYFLVVMVPMGLLYFGIQKIYIKSVRQMKRIDSVRRSPVYSHYGETLAGESSVRAYRVQQQFIDRVDRLIDENQKAQYVLAYVERWQSVVLNIIASGVIFFAGVFSVLDRENISGGNVGLSLSFALQSAFFFTTLVHATTELETTFIPVERIKEYSEVEQEAPWMVEGNEPAESWPSKGAVEFINYSTRYRSGLDLVLKDINCQIQPGEKVGIVGRTGAGKSSLTLAMFRIIEASGGRIVIDGVNTSFIGLHNLRSKLTIIPQEPVLFSGSLRTNLDPFDVYSDDAIWLSLERAHLKDHVNSLPEGLSYEVGESGVGLSVGQRQLLCLARALLRKCKVLVLDEATAAVDLQTDELIQATIRTCFSDCTVITIAHRLNTVMDYHRVMVLDNGKIAEYDTPTNLLKDRATVFYAMAEGAGLV